MDHRHKYEPKTIKSLYENIGTNFYFRQSFPRYSINSDIHKGEIDKLDFKRHYQGNQNVSYKQIKYLQIL